LDKSYKMRRSKSEKQRKRRKSGKDQTLRKHICKGGTVSKDKSCSCLFDGQILVKAGASLSRIKKVITGTGNQCWRSLHVIERIWKCFQNRVAFGQPISIPLSPHVGHFSGKDKLFEQLSTFPNFFNNI